MISQDLKRKEIFLRLKNVIEQMLQMTREKDLRKRAEVVESLHLINDLGVDSLEIMDLVAAVEKEFGITIDVQQFASQGIIGDIVGYIQNRIAEKK